MNLDAIDVVFFAWAARHGLRALRLPGGQQTRFCYVSAGVDESFQISIEPPEAGIVSVNAWDVETHDDAEFHRAWQVPLSDLEPALDGALEQIATWAARPRQGR